MKSTLEKFRELPDSVEGVRVEQAAGTKEILEMLEKNISAIEKLEAKIDSLGKLYNGLQLNFNGLISRLMPSESSYTPTSTKDEDLWRKEQEKEEQTPLNMWRV